MAKSKIDVKRGKPAKSTVYPVLVEGNKSKIKVVIESGRTHQIRVHLNSVGLPIIGDAIYGRVSSNVNRVLLHSKVTKIFDYTFEASEPKEFRVYDFNS
jgi:23S rRNA pseudouridine1911/1915/1917 synthase